MGLVSINVTACLLSQTAVFASYWCVLRWMPGVNSMARRL
jgi:hypothetical protein